MQNDKAECGGKGVCVCWVSSDFSVSSRPTSLFSGSGELSAGTIRQHSTSVEFNHCGQPL
jgi:hypothetical protein